MKACVNGFMENLSPEDVAWVETAAAQQVYIETAHARSRRNLLLVESDWSQGRDVPDSISTPWAEYRQALRDLTDQAGFPLNIEWPQNPMAAAG